MELTQLRAIALCARWVDEFQADPKANVYPTPLASPTVNAEATTATGVAREARATPPAIASPDATRTSLTLTTLS
jgi:hypothetical protein